MITEYHLYCQADPLFYDLSRVAGSSPFEAAARDDLALPEGWRRSRNQHWIRLFPPGCRLPPQGWKIHLSGRLDNAERLVRATWSYCLSRGIAFKFLPDADAVFRRNAKYAPRSGSGKLITIYPADEAELETVCMELGRLVEGEPGPYILSDLRVGNGPLYVRYGGFARRMCTSEDGVRVPAIADPSGKLVPDIREPVFRMPRWVTLPAFLQPSLAARAAVTVADLPYTVDSVLHHSNSGGVYGGRDVRTGEEVVLKEARPHAGLTGDGQDAVARLRHEGAIMRQLTGLKCVPRALGHFTVGEHEFLAMEYVDGTALRKACRLRYPLIDSGIEKLEPAAYAAWALEVYGRVEQAVAAVHDQGVVLGDLHPSNILVRPDGRVVLVDLEGSAPVDQMPRQRLAARGFLAPRDRTGFAIDGYALAVLRLELFWPMTSVLHLDVGKAAHFADIIAEHFPVPRPWLNEAVAAITGRRPAKTRRPNPRLDPDEPGWERARKALSRAIEASATPGRDDRLFPADAAQFATATGGLSLAHGAAAVLYALHTTGSGRFPAYEQWLLDRATRVEDGTRVGFYQGLHGVAHVLEHLGYRNKALDVLELCLKEPWDSSGDDLDEGLAGIGLNLLHFADRTDDSGYRQAAFRVIDLLCSRRDTADGHQRAGLMHGAAGPALLFLHAYEDSGDTALLDQAATALRQDLRRCTVRDSGAMHVDEGWRTMPYLASGSVGIGLVLDRYLTHRADDEFSAASEAIRRAARSPFYVQPGLFNGRAGMVLYHAVTRPTPQAACGTDAAEQIRRLAWHAVDHYGGLAFPGEQLMRLSMDLSSGTAGVLFALGAALHDRRVHLPFLDPP
ncbi:class III lanthionine synthetase LanKC [Streptomyces sp. NPDC002088]|uniref:class III lanthionine synthetase LanKC n=1 Tax=Streptomyces sp. NPDC002088 TaxID=3154665 RepID=UPI00332FA6F8